MNRKLTIILSLLISGVFVLSACAPATPAVTEAPQPAAPTPAPTEAATEAPTQAPTEMATEAATEAPAQPQSALGLPGPLEGMTWDEIVAAADGQTVNWWMWGGSDTTNAFVNGWMAEQLKARYNITMHQVPVAGPTEFINQVLGEKQAGVNEGGAVDIMWINGENFRTMKDADLLYGPWAEAVPSGQYYDWKDPSIAFDFGYPVDGYEIPWGSAQVVLEYDTAKVPEPPKDMAALVQWIKDNPGLFTYPAPPDFTGSVWVRMMCYYATGGYQQFLGEFNQALFDEKFPACWDLLNEIEPYLWREGQTYPDTQQADIDLFANGEVYFRMTYGPGDAQTYIDSGVYPDTVRTFVLDDGTIANTNYIAAAYNAANLPAAVVTADFIASPEAQLQRMVQLNATVPLWVEKVPPDIQQKMAAVERGPAMLPSETLNAHKLPELQADWLVAIEKGWEENVLKK
jgi:putative spermidine/putrescine transport system substrate-binding protein